MKSLPLTLVFLAGIASIPVIRAQVPAAKITALKGDIHTVIKFTGADRKLALTPDEWLWIGTEVVCPPESSLTLAYQGGEVETHTGGQAPDGSDKRIKVKTIAFPAAEKNVAEFLQPAARSQAGNALLVAPESASFRPGSGLTIHWQAPADVTTVVVTVRVAGGPVAWTQSLPAAQRSITSPELNQKLAEHVAAGKDTFRISCTRPGAPAIGMSSQVTALPAAKEKDLEAQLAACGAPTDPGHGFLRAATFRHFELYEEALREMEGVLARPELARDPHVITAAANLFEIVGQSARAEALRAQLNARLR